MKESKGLSIHKNKNLACKLYVIPAQIKKKVRIIVSESICYESGELCLSL